MSAKTKKLIYNSVTFGIDLYNDKVVYETDTIGTFNVDINGGFHFYRNANIPSLGSVIGDPIHPEYQNRVLACAAVAESALGFSHERYAIMIALYMALDGMGTACNLTGDGAIALIVDRFRGRKSA